MIIGGSCHKDFSVQAIAGPSNTHCALTMSPTGLYTLTVTADNGQPPTGSATITANRSVTHTLVPADNGILTVQAIAGSGGPPVITSATFAGDGNFNGSVWVNSVTSCTETVNTGTQTVLTYAPTNPRLDETKWIILYVGTVTSFTQSQAILGRMQFDFTKTGAAPFPSIVGLNFGTF